MPLIDYDWYIVFMVHMHVIHMTFVSHQYKTNHGDQKSVFKVAITRSKNSVANDKADGAEQKEL